MSLTYSGVDKAPTLQDAAEALDALVTRAAAVTCDITRFCDDVAGLAYELDRAVRLEKRSKGGGS
jgi:hypothetical protein